MITQSLGHIFIQARHIVWYYICFQHFYIWCFFFSLIFRFHQPARYNRPKIYHKNKIPLFLLMENIRQAFLGNDSQSLGQFHR